MAKLKVKAEFVGNSTIRIWDGTGWKNVNLDANTTQEDLELVFGTEVGKQYIEEVKEQEENGKDAKKQRLGNSQD